MLPYVVFFIVIALICLSVDGIGRWLGYAALFVILLFLSMRDGVGYDYEAYYNVYYWGEEWIDKVWGAEPLNGFIYKIFIPYDCPGCVIAFYGIITCVLFYCVILKYSKNLGASLLLFVAYPLFFLYSMSVIRQFLAVGIVFYGYKYIRDRNFVRYLLVVFIASLIHNTAIYLIVLYFVYQWRLSDLLIIVLYLLSLFLSDSVFALFSHFEIPVYGKYVLESVGYGLGGEKLQLLTNILFVVLFFIRRTYIFNEDDEFFFFAFFLGVIIYNLLQPFGHAGVRFHLYFGVYLMLLVPSVLKLFGPGYLVRFFYVFFLFLLYVTFLYIDYISLDGSGYFPYKIIAF